MYINAGNTIKLSIIKHPDWPVWHCGVLVFPSGSLPDWGQHRATKGQPPGNLFYCCPITVQTQGVVSGKPIII